MTKKEMLDPGRDRRNAIRVTDRVLLYYRITPEKEYQQLADEWQRGIMPYSRETLAQMHLYTGAQAALGRARERDEDLTEFLRFLDTKLNLLLGMAGKGETIFDKLQSQEVSLSSTGISFATERVFPQDERLEIHLVLLPAYSYVYALARVVGCTENTGALLKYRVGAEFSLIMEEDREKLVQHNFRQQTILLRHRRVRKE